MTERERRRAFIEIGFAIGVLIGCLVLGGWLANVGPAEHHFDAPEQPIERTATQPPITRDPFVAVAPTPRATVRAGATPVASPAPVPSRGAVYGAGPRPPRATSAPRPTHVPPRPSSAPSAAPSAPQTPAPAPVSTPRPCLVSVLGVCIRL